MRAGAAPRVRARWRAAAVAVVALIASTLPAASSAAQSTASSISGTFAVPAGTVASDFYIDVHRANDAGGWELDDFTTPFPDGTFVLDGLEAGREYRLGVYSAEQLHLGGFYAGPGAQLVANPEDGIAVQAGLTGVELATVTAVPLTGTFSVPPGFDWSAGGFGISALELTADGEDYRHRVYATVDGTAGGSFTLPFVRPGGTYVIYVWDSSARRFASGYHHAGGLTSRMWHGTPVTSLQDIHVTITPELIEPAVSAVTEPRVQGSAVVGQKLSATVGTWSLRGTSLAIQWLRDGKAVLGANGATFVLEPEDLGARLSVRVTGTADGFPAGSATSVPTAPVTAAAAPRPAKAPSLTGTARLGGTLQAHPGAWSLDGVQLDYQWMRGGSPIKGATSARYRLKAADVGSRVSVRVTARVAGHVDGVASSAAVRVAKGKPKAKVSAPSVAASKRPKLVVRVKAPGLARPKGTVTVRYGSGTVRATLRPKAQGKVTVRLPKLSPGGYAITVRFTPSGGSASALKKSRPVRVVLRVA